MSSEIEAAIEETNRLTELVSTLLQLARADEYRETVTVDLRGLVVERIDTWTALADAGGVRLVGPDPSPPVGALLVETVPSAVEQILDNLLDNALGVAPVGSTVQVLARPEGDVAVLTVIDDGPGLSDDAKADATRRFWRGDARRPGTGLGLAIVDALSTASGGSVRLADSKSGGLTVEVRLRRVAATIPD